MSKKRPVSFSATDELLRDIEEQVDMYRPYLRNRSDWLAWAASLMKKFHMNAETIVELTHALQLVNLVIPCEELPREEGGALKLQPQSVRELGLPKSAQRPAKLEAGPTYRGRLEATESVAWRLTPFRLSTSVRLLEVA